MSKAVARAFLKMLKRFLQKVMFFFNNFTFFWGGGISISKLFQLASFRKIFSKHVENCIKMNYHKFCAINTLVVTAILRFLKVRILEKKGSASISQTMIASELGFISIESA